MDIKLRDAEKVIRINELDPDIIEPRTENHMDPKSTGSKICVIGKTGCFRIGTKVRMYDNSIKSIEDVTIGELVMGDDSTSREVLSLCRGRSKMYEIKQSYAMTYVVNKDHQLALITSDDCKFQLNVEYFDSTSNKEYQGYRIDKKNNIVRSTLTVTELSVETYYGFTLDKNNLFQLEDGTIVKNTGKCLHPDTKILLQNGTVKAAKDIKVGDVLLGDDNTSRNVLSICTGEEDLYLVNQTNGGSYIVNKSHILTLWDMSKATSLYKGSRALIDISVKDYLKLETKVYFRGIRKILNFSTGLSKSNQECKLKAMLFIRKEFLKKDESLSHIKYLFSLNYLSRIKILEYIMYYSRKEGKYNEITSILILSDNRSANMLTLAFNISGWLAYTNNNVVHIKRISNIDEKNYVLSEIDVSLYPESRKYCGFELDGNGRFLLADCTVTHNTTLITSILYAKKHIYPVYEIYSGTEDSNHFYGEIFPPIFVHNELTVTDLDRYIKRQKIAKKYLSNPWAVCLIDDCTDNPALLRKPIFGKIFKNGRHWKSLFIFSMQYCLDVIPALRTNIDGTFLLRETIPQNRKKLYDCYAGSFFDSYSDFCDTFDICTQDRTAMYIHNRTTSNNIEDCVFYYRATPIPESFKFGCQDLWTFHDTRYNLDYNDIDL
jgi:hypothetical protein